MYSNLAVITGASKGIGAEIARQLAEAGYAVLLVARSAKGLNNIAQYIEAEGGRAFPLPCDITKGKDILKVVDFVSGFNGKFKALIHNAGIAKVGNATEMEPRDWRRVLDTNLTAPFLLTRQLAGRLHEGGQIIFINSTAGKNTFPGWSAYCASKFGLRGFADTLRQELAPTGVRVTTIYPAAVDTPIHDDLPFDWDRQRMMKAADIGRAILYCLKQPPSVRINEIELENPAGKF